MKARRGVQRIEAVESEPVLGMELPSIEDDSLSLEQLGKVYAEMLAGNSETTEGRSDGSTSSAILTEGEPGTESPSGELKAATRETVYEAPSEELAITPEGIIEALLFVGQPNNKPLTKEQIASTMRGVHADEIPEFVERLNKTYQTTGRVMRIFVEEDGYCMRVAPEMRRSSNTVEGKLRETRLPPAAVDCLALVAYNPGATREDIEKLWNRSASSILSLLVRKELLEIRRDEADESQGKPKKPKILEARYHPTERFLNLLGLSSLQDLPRVDSDL